MLLDRTNKGRSYSSNFSGGLKRFLDSSAIPDDAYAFLSNARSRDGKIRPVKKPLRVEGIPAGKNIQGIYSAGQYKLVFAGGECYYKDLDNSSFISFQKLSGFQMSANAEFIYLELVPASTLNYARISADGLPEGNITLSNPSIPSEAAAVVQDGINQPKIILPNGLVRNAQTFDQWSFPNSREYIPVGKMMLYQDGILYIVSPDGKVIYRSVQGRPFDFVIAIKTDGNKITDGLYSVEANRLSHTVDFNEITCIKSLAIDTGGFYVGTRNSSYIVVPNYEITHFGQPSFNNIPFLPTGPLNQFSVVDLLGDTALINESGIRSFNAILQTKNEGESIPFHADISSLLENPITGKTLIQSVTCAIEFSDYVFFAVNNTIFGSGILVYDNVKKVYVSFDQYSGIGAIKGMSTIKRNNIRELFFYDTNNNVYQAFSSNETESIKFYPRDWISHDPEIEQKPLRYRIILEDIIEGGTINLSNYTDRQKGKLLSETIETPAANTAIPLEIPFGPSTEDKVKNLTFTFQEARAGWKAGCLIEMNFMAAISFVGIISDLEEDEVSKEQQARIAARV